MPLKLLLKRGALLAAANWPVVAIQFVAETTFQVLLAVPIIGAAVLVAVLLGADLADLLQGSMRQIFTTIASALMSEPLALVSFMCAFVVVLLGGSMFMFLVKGGTVDVLISANDAVGALEKEAITFESIRPAMRFTIERYINGCARLFRRYLKLGLALIAVYVLSTGAYLGAVVYGYRMIGDRVLFLGWTFFAALAAGGLVVWMTFVNFIYLLLQMAMAMDDVAVMAAFPLVARFLRNRTREVAGVFLIILMLVVVATFASALAWSGVGLIAFVPLVGLAVFPLQLAALVLRGLIFEYIGLTALGAYVTLYRGHVERRAQAVGHSPVASTPLGNPA